ncbi:O-antigen polymerase [Limnohabitans sp. B9-3]|uniref:O-antigen polymerase n=1 Tax=Limnohabitans sp. B9-3 TaxID=1100707 RepID=UPI0013042689|nr:O-antigen polymerase [Limnohabitans sp. B9-3]
MNNKKSKKLVKKIFTKNIILLVILVVVIVYLSFITDYEGLASFTPYFLFIQISIYLLGSGRTFDVFDPYHGVSILHLLYSSAALMFVAEARFIPQGDYINISHALEFSKVSLFIQITLSFVNNIFSNQKIQDFAPANNSGLKLERGSIRLALLILLALLMLQVGELNPIGISSYGDRVLDYNVNKRGQSTSGLTEFIEIFAQIGILFLSVYILIVESKKNHLRLFAVSIIGLLLVKYFLAGDRSSLVTCIFFLLIVRHYFVANLNIVYVLLCSIFGYVIFNLISIARVSSDPFEMIFIVTNYILENGITIFALDKSGELMAGANFIKLISEVDATGVRFGGNALDSILSFIPRFMMNREAYFGNETFVRWYYPEVFTQGGGHGYFLPMDGYWDFGVVGALVFMVVYLSILKHFYYLLLKNKSKIIYIFVYAVFFSQLIAFGMRSGVYAASKQFLIYAAPLVLIILLLRFENTKIRNRKVV